MSFIQSYRHFHPLAALQTAVSTLFTLETYVYYQEDEEQVMCDELCYWFNRNLDESSAKWRKGRWVRFKMGKLVSFSWCGARKLSVTSSEAGRTRNKLIVRMWWKCVRSGSVCDCWVSALTSPSTERTRHCRICELCHCGLSYFQRFMWITATPQLLRCGLDEWPMLWPSYTSWPFCNCVLDSCICTPFGMFYLLFQLDRFDRTCWFKLLWQAVYFILVAPLTTQLTLKLDILTV